MIVYIHGFNSSPASHKSNLLRRRLEAIGRVSEFSCPALPHWPEEAMALLEAQLGGMEPGQVTLVGSSLGGFYATHFAERLGLRAVLINPAITPYVGLEAYLGTQKNLYTGATYELTRADLEAWRTLAVERADPERYLLLLETGDEVLDWRDAARKYEGARTVIRDGGDHTLQSFPEHIPRILAFAGIALS